tara:strand:- start:16 stop:537 length:522 start_codon:yes stop_codon:yes gene_type:complete
MAGSLVKISETTVSSGVSSVTITGIDSTYDVYKLIINGLSTDADSLIVEIRVTKGGTADTTSNYDEAAKQLKVFSSFVNNTDTNATSWGLNNTGTDANSSLNLIAYLFNFPNASEYSFATFEENTSDSSTNVRGKQGGGVHTVASASDGINVFTSNGSGNIHSGTFTLYGLKK